MNVVVIEDEKLTAQRLISLIKKYDKDIQILAELSSVEDSIAWFQEYQQNSSVDSRVDLIFMDIHLEDGDSFQIIRALNLSTPIIFTTAYDEYMIKAFKVNSIDYLLKPINYEDLAAAVDKFKSFKSVMSAPEQNNATVATLDQLLASLGKNRLESYRERFMITVGTKIRTIQTADIAYFFLEEKTVFLTTCDDMVLPVDYSLDRLMQMIDPKNFFRINRQFIVSVSSIHLVHTYSAGKLKLDLKPKPRQEVFVSGDRITEFKEWLGK